MWTGWLLVQVLWFGLGHRNCSMELQLEHLVGLGPHCPDHDIMMMLPSLCYSNDFCCAEIMLRGQASRHLSFNSKNIAGLVLLS